MCMRVAAIFVLLFAGIASAQQPSNPPPTTPPQEPKTEEKDIELNTVLMESTFLIEGHTTQGATIGTVFVIGLPIPNTTPAVARYVMVTAAHVLEEMQVDTAVLHLRRKMDEKTITWV